MSDSSYHGNHSTQFDFVQALGVLWRYRYGLVGLTLSAAVISALVVFSVKPEFRGTATMLIEPKSNVVVQIDEVYDPGYGTSDYQKTQHEILRSRELAARAVDQLGLQDHPQFNEQVGKSIVQNMIEAARELLPVLNESGEQRDKRDATIDAFMRRLSVTPVVQTQLVKIHFDSHFPALSAKVPNLLAELYIKLGLEAKYSATEQASDWLKERVEGVKDELADAEKGLQAFRDREDVASVSASRELNELELSDNMERLREARRNKTALENTVAKIRGAGSEVERMQEIPAIEKDPLVQTTKQSFLDASEERKRVASRYGPKHPKMIAAKAQFDEARDAYFRQLRIAAEGIRAEYEIAAENVRSLQRVVNESKERIKALDRKGYEIGVLEREVETNRELYDLFLTRFKETSTSGEFDLGNARVVDPAVVPDEHFRPKRGLTILASTLCGLLFACGCAFFINLLDNTVKSPNELEQLIAVPVIGMLPSDSKLKTPILAAKGAMSEPRSVFAEGVRTVRTNLILGTADKEGVVMITSSVPEEGKTTLAINLASMLAENEKILLIDADLRKPAGSATLNLPKGRPGLSDLLAATATIQDCAYQAEGMNFDFIGAGTVPGNAVQILGSPRFREIIAQFKQHYDRILIDSAPVEVVSDSLLLAQTVDAAIFVARADHTNRKLVTSAVRKLRHVDAPLIGAVLSRVDLKQLGADGAGYRYYEAYYA